MADHLQQSAGFSSGNPVFDAFVTVVCQSHADLKTWEALYEKLLCLAEKEPGGLRRLPGMLQADGQLPTARTN